MAAPRYLWRQLNLKQREVLLAWRKERGYPWHSPPHRPNFGHLRFLVSATCFEHHYHIGHSVECMDDFSRDLLAVLTAHAGRTFAWCVLPNHYHALVEAPDIKLLLHDLGLLHGGTSHAWNGKEQTRGEKFSSVSSSARCVQIAITGPR